MSRLSVCLLVSIALAAFAFVAVPAGAADKKAESGKTIVLFDGKDLAGWKVKGKSGKSRMDRRQGRPRREEPVQAERHRPATAES